MWGHNCVFTIEWCKTCNDSGHEILFIYSAGFICKELDSVLFWFQIILLVDLSRRFMRKSCDLYHESISRVEDWHHWQWILSLKILDEWVFPSVLFYLAIYFVFWINFRYEALSFEYLNTKWNLWHRKLSLPCGWKIIWRSTVEHKVIVACKNLSNVEKLNKHYHRMPILWYELILFTLYAWLLDFLILLKAYFIQLYRFCIIDIIIKSLHQPQIKKIKSLPAQQWFNIHILDVA